MHIQSVAIRNNFVGIIILLHTQLHIPWSPSVSEEDLSLPPSLSPSPGAGTPVFSRETISEYFFSSATWSGVLSSCIRHQYIRHMEH